MNCTALSRANSEYTRHIWHMWYRHINMMMYIYAIDWMTCIRPTQSIIYVPLLVCVFDNSILLIVQYKYLKSFSKDFKLQNLILPTRLCGTGFIPQHCWVVDFYLTKMVRWKWFVQGLYQLRKGKLTGLALKYFYMIHRGRRGIDTWIWWCIARNAPLSPARIQSIHNMIEYDIDWTTCMV